MLPGLEAVLDGLEKGAKRDGVLKAKDAFGNPAMHPLKKMKRTEFPKDAKLNGRREARRARATSDMNVILQIEKVGGDDVDVRLVHPLAEKDIKYSVEVVQVSDPRPPPMPAAALELEEESKCPVHPRRLYAHRGASAERPENTMPAFAARDRDRRRRARDRRPPHARRHVRSSRTTTPRCG